MKNIKLKITGIKDNISKEKLINKLKEKKGIKKGLGGCGFHAALPSPF